MDPKVTLIGMGTGLPGRTSTVLNDDKHTALDIWKPQNLTWGEVLQVSKVSEYQDILFLALIRTTDTSTGAGYVWKRLHSL